MQMVTSLVVGVRRWSSLSIDAWLFTLLIGGYGIALALSFRGVYASLLVMVLALVSIGLYLGVERPTVRLTLVCAAIGAIAIAPTLLGIYLRHLTDPSQYAHDGLIQVEEAAKLLLAGKNPYAENYLNTPMARWHFAEPNVAVNPALYHLAYLPFLVDFSAPFVGIIQPVIGWFDERMIFLPLFVATLILATRLATSRENELALALAIGLNPLLVPFLAEGRNDIFILFWVVVSVFLLRSGHRVWSVVMIAFACATKETAWLILPFYALYFVGTNPDVADKRRRQKLVEQVHDALPAFAVFAAVMSAIILPFLLWNPRAFVDDVLLYPAGLTEHGYPIKSIGFGGLALALGWIHSNTAQFPFGVFQALFGLPVLGAMASVQQKRNTIAQVWLGYAVLLFVVGLFSHVFNDNHLGYIICLLAIGLLA